MSLFLRRPSSEARRRVAIIDIGSNSIRLVVYEGPTRLPAILFNEKVMAGLGRDLADTGAIADDGIATARSALARFSLLARQMEVHELRTVATAAVRDASNGGELLAVAADLGLEVELLSGDAEAMASGHGVLSAIPDADGIVGDLGGGSLELVRVQGGQVGERVSFPLGVLRIAAIREKGKVALDRHVERALAAAGWTGRGQGLPLYMVGGSWRALARLDMYQSGYPLPVIHGYSLSPETVQRLIRTLGHLPKNKLRAIPNLSGGRVATMGDSAHLLASLIRHLGAATCTASAYGLREGLLYGALDEPTRALDPLVVAAREEGRRLGRFAEHGDLLDNWIAPLFEDEDEALARLRHAACLLADVAWLANPEFRAERGLEVALHGNWVAIDAAGRALLAQALFTCFGGGSEAPDPLARLAEPQALERAVRWGLAMRLGQRLSGGVAAPLRQTALCLSDDAVELHTAPGLAPLYGEAVERRHKALAGAMARAPLHVPA
ncbi:Ppx/GppA family phosphatase [Sphingomonas sp.]|uniref:Ppx/GppA family phosphatase n=1 Tax=Sphingomonas sp. TaxID=28214 RepID=UPI002B5D5CCC|nr:Ppx/GppA family phosphatase [Sphingomonas sp.]HTG39965.1 Ppx/GppA family phosphatase [Sphingomonas sp.]